MKTLIIYKNKNSNAVAAADDSKNTHNAEIDIITITNDSVKTINDLYYKCPKNYCYYLFIDYNIKDIIVPEINYKIILDIIHKYKPAILVLNEYLKIYHRSVVHYVYPLLDFNKYGNSIFEIQSIIEEPLLKYTCFLESKPAKLPYNKTVYAKLIHWFQPCIVKRYNNSNVQYITLNDPINKLNFLNTFDIFKYFDVEHEYFKMKRLRFHKNNHEMYGHCGTYHFAHDFHNSNRNSIINHLIKKNKYETYLEIGLYNASHFDDVIVEYKYGIDPSPLTTSPYYQKHKEYIYHMTSEDFFKNTPNDLKYDIIFIDGCLYEYNVMNDVLNSLKRLKNNGAIVLHDCNPPCEFFQRNDYNTRYYGLKKNNIIWNNKTYTDRHWNGFSWKVIMNLRLKRDDLIVYTVDTDWGCGVIQKINDANRETAKKINGLNDINILKSLDEKDLEKYETFAKYRKYILNLISPETFLGTLF